MSDFAQHIGKLVHVEWREPQYDWHMFSLLAVHGDELWLKGEPDNGVPHAGDTFIVREDEIRSMSAAKRHPGRR